VSDSVSEIPSPSYWYRFAVLRRDDPCLDDLGQRLIGAPRQPFIVGVLRGINLISVLAA
jgi:hypothetical protein